MFYLSDAPLISARTFPCGRLTPIPRSGAFHSAPLQIAPPARRACLCLDGTEGGERLSFVFSKGASHVFVARLQFPGPNLADVQRLTRDTRTDYPHAWLHDNETVIYESNRVSAYRLYGQRLQDPKPREFNTGPAPRVLPRITPDGKWILYVSNPDTIMSSSSRLFRIPTDGGPPEQVSLDSPLQEFGCPLRSGSCVLLQFEEHKTLRYFVLDPLTGKGREMGRTAWGSACAR